MSYGAVSGSRCGSASYQKQGAHSALQAILDLVPSHLPTPLQMLSFDHLPLVSLVLHSVLSCLL